MKRLFLGLALIAMTAPGVSAAGVNLDLPRLEFGTATGAATQSCTAFTQTCGH